MPDTSAHPNPDPAWPLRDDDECVVQPDHPEESGFVELSGRDFMLVKIREGTISRRGLDRAALRVDDAEVQAALVAYHLPSEADDGFLAELAAAQCFDRGEAF